MATTRAGVAANAMVSQKSSKRFDRIATLMQRIDSATDPKAIADLQARIQIEQTMLQNELIRAQAMNAMIVNQREVDYQAAQQRAAAQSFKY